jgi:hypothetical protein
MRRVDSVKYLHWLDHYYPYSQPDRRRAVLLQRLWPAERSISRNRRLALTGAASTLVATNNGVQYSFSPSALIIGQGSTVVNNEPTVEYRSDQDQAPVRRFVPPSGRTHVVR